MGDSAGDKQVQRHFGEKPPRAFAPDGKIAIDRPFKPAAHGPAIDGAHHWLCAKHDGHGCGLNGIDQPARLLFGFGVHMFVAIIPRAKGTPRPGKHNRARVGAGIGIVKGPRHIQYQLQVHRVQRLRAVQRDGAHAWGGEGRLHGFIGICAHS